MSTKNLARTVIEGGRHRVNRKFRRLSSKQERVAEHRLSRRLACGDGFEGVVYEPRKVVFRAFDDKLAPAERWLGRQVGRPWDKIRSELMRRFDTRTTAGRHIVFCHLLRSVRLGQVEDPWRRFDFAVDRHGILRAVKRVRPRRSALHANLPEPKSVLLRWLGTRRVGERGVRLYWFVLTPSGGFRQASPLDDAEAARFRALPGWFREEWDAFAARPGEGSPSWQAR